MQNNESEQYLSMVYTTHFHHSEGLSGKVNFCNETFSSVVFRWLKLKMCYFGLATLTTNIWCVFCVFYGELVAKKY